MVIKNTRKIYFKKSALPEVNVLSLGLLYFLS